MTPIDRTELDRLRELAAEATPGPWHEDGPHWWTIAVLDRAAHNDSAATQFIAYANPERVTRLVGLVEELTGRLRDWLTWMSAVAHADALADDDASGTSMELDFQATQILEAARVLLDRLGAT